MEGQKGRVVDLLGLIKKGNEHKHVVSLVLAQDYGLIQLKQPRADIGVGGCSKVKARFILFANVNAMRFDPLGSIKKGKEPVVLSNFDAGVWQVFSRTNVGNYLHTFVLGKKTLHTGVNPGKLNERTLCLGGWG